MFQLSLIWQISDTEVRKEEKKYGETSVSAEIDCKWRAGYLKNTEATNF